MSKTLSELKSVSNKFYHDGNFHVSKSTSGFDVIDPATELVVGSVLETTNAEIDMMIHKCNEVQKIWWKDKSAVDRSHAMHEVASKIEKMKPLLAESLTREMGKPYKESLDEVDWCVHSLRYSAEIGRSEMGRVMGPAVAGQFHYTIKQPVGTVAFIMPFNFPLVLLAWEAGAALAGGNACIVKPSEYTTLTTFLFAQAFDHLPSGLFQVVSGGGKVGEYLVKHSNTHGVAFTGSIPVGRSVSGACGDLMKPALIETSGNDPFLVMPSASVDIAARAAAFSAYMNCGQICVSAERFFVHEQIDIVL